MHTNRFAALSAVPLAIMAPAPALVDEYRYARDGVPVIDGDSPISDMREVTLVWKPTPYQTTLNPVGSHP